MHLLDRDATQAAVSQPSDPYSYFDLELIFHIANEFLDAEE